MTRKEIIEKVAEETGVSKKIAKDAIEVYESAVAATIKNGGTHRIPELGTMSVGTRQARMGRNPKTGEAISIPEKKFVRFKTSSKF